MPGNSLNPSCLLCVFTKKSCLVETRLSCVYLVGGVSGHMAEAGHGDPETPSFTLKNGRGSPQICFCLFYQLCFCLPAAVPKGWSVVRYQPVLPSSHQTGSVWKGSTDDIFWSGTVPPSCHCRAVPKAGLDFQGSSKNWDALKAEGKIHSFILYLFHIQMLQIHIHPYTDPCFSILAIAFNTDKH